MDKISYGAQKSQIVLPEENTNLRYKQIFLNVKKYASNLFKENTCKFISCTLAVTILSIYVFEMLDRYRGAAPVSHLYAEDCLLVRFQDTPDCVNKSFLGGGVEKACKVSLLLVLAGTFLDLIYAVFEKRIQEFIGPPPNSLHED